MDIDDVNMRPKPKHLQPRYGDQFSDESVVNAYRYRPRYPDELFGFEAMGSKRTTSVVRTQTIDEHVEFWHSRNGLSRQRMSSESQRTFDSGVRGAVKNHATDGIVEMKVSASIVWGRP